MEKLLPLLLQKQFESKLEQQYGKWEPRTREEAIEFEREKSGKLTLTDIENLKQKGNLPIGTTANVGGLTIPLNRPYSEFEVKNLATAEALTREIGSLNKIVETEGDKPIWKQAQTRALLPKPVQKFLGYKRAQEYAMLKKSIGERLLRLRSGAQINESEYARFMEMLPQIFREDSLDLQQLASFQTEFQSVIQRIQTGRGSSLGSQIGPQTDLSTLSDEDLQRIAAGG